MRCCHIYRPTGRSRSASRASKARSIPPTRPARPPRPARMRRRTPPRSPSSWARCGRRCWTRSRSPMASSTAPMRWRACTTPMRLRPWPARSTTGWPPSGWPRAAAARLAGGAQPAPRAGGQGDRAHGRPPRLCAGAAAGALDPALWQPPVSPAVCGGGTAGPGGRRPLRRRAWQPANAGRLAILLYRRVRRHGQRVPVAAAQHGQRGALRPVPGPAGGAARERLHLDAVADVALRQGVERAAARGALGASAALGLYPRACCG